MAWLRTVLEVATLVLVAVMAVAVLRLSQRSDALERDLQWQERCLRTLAVSHEAADGEPVPACPTP